MNRRVETLRRWAGGSLALAGLVYLAAETITAAAWDAPRYDYADNYISDLGAPVCGVFHGRPVCSPLHGVMNAGFVLEGVFFVLGAILVGLAWRGSRARAFLVLAIVHLIGLTLVAAVPETTPAPLGRLHALGALLAIAGGNLAIVAGGFAIRRATPRWLPTASLALGAFGMTAFAYLAGHGALPPGSFPDLGEGLVERFSVYPITAWEIVAGVLLLRGRSGGRELA